MLQILEVSKYSIIIFSYNVEKETARRLLHYLESSTENFIRTIFKS